MVCYRHNRDLSVAQCQTCGLGLCADCARVFHPPTCRRCELAKAQAAVKPAFRRALAAVALLVGAYFGISSAIGALLHATIPYVAAYPARHWTMAHVRMIETVLTYLLAAWPYGLKSTSGFRLPQGYILPVSWYFDMLQWRFFGGLLIGPFVLPLEVVRDFQMYRFANELERFAQEPPPPMPPPANSDAAPRNVTGSWRARIVQTQHALNDDIIEQ